MIQRYRDALTEGRKGEVNAKGKEHGAGLVQGLGKKENFIQPLKKYKRVRQKGVNTKSLETISVCSMDIKWRIHRGRKC